MKCVEVWPAGTYRCCEGLGLGARARGSKSAPSIATNLCDPPTLDAPRGDDACTNPALCAPTTASDIAFSSAPIATALSTVSDAYVCDDAA